jgi:2-polyprenyl-3-methyl-5-hydroxy-6-metoxy-1,4-benzoquinol methylase
MDETDPNAATDCPICGSLSAPYCQKSSRGQSWRISRCGSCGHGFVVNRPTRQMLADMYANEADHHPIDKVAALHIEDRADCRTLAARVKRLSQLRGDALDIGCGDGAFSYYLAEAGYRPILIDLDPRAAQAAAKVPNSIFRQISFDDFIPDRPLAAIVMSQVLEHALDPLDWLRRAAKLLSPEGVLAVAVPNFGGIYRLLGARDPFIIPPIHLNYFTTRSLRVAIERSGLRHLRTESRSEVVLNNRLKAVGKVWNVLAVPFLNLTRAGIILREYAVPAESIENLAPPSA